MRKQTDTAWFFFQPQYKCAGLPFLLPPLFRKISQPLLVNEHPVAITIFLQDSPQGHPLSYFYELLFLSLSLSRTFSESCIFHSGWGKCIFLQEKGEWERNYEKPNKMTIIKFVSLLVTSFHKSHDIWGFCFLFCCTLI